MFCQECQEADARVHLTKIINGKKQEIYLCEGCARKKGDLDLGLSIDLSFNNILTGLLNGKLHPNNSINHMNLSSCNECGLTYESFSKKGRLACSKCYGHFEERIDKALRRIHSSNKHIGKIPKRVGEDIKIKKRIKSLKNKMDEAVNCEEFEQAAEIRDEIKRLKVELGRKGEVNE
ncbi:UvrB/UvrC motif-containing protein [Halonatronum saccharophilum]|uniref:UvrB/UvrC motif-containing protein n=1 Tax=Halonatronum saccharophilum TaxID=150060 RepID=UPI0004853272|nr:UvrB/UvrC motif-containing protein [Halonatronum saccharophilum]